MATSRAGEARGPLFDEPDGRRNQFHCPVPGDFSIRQFFRERGASSVAVRAE
jgi:hypothetical protein